MTFLVELLKRVDPKVLGYLVVGATVVVLIFLGAIVFSALKYGRALSFFHIISLGARAAKEDEKSGPSSTGASSPAAATSPGSGQVLPMEERMHRKILYVKVVYLSDRTAAGAEPFYERIVNRLEPVDRSVPVYDEAIYYTLELFPKKRAIEGRRDNSSGVADTSIVVPWRDEVPFADATERTAKQIVMVDVPKDTDTLLTVSHFENGLQGKDHQDFATKIPEGAEYARLVVDFSSVPGASLFISPRYACVSTESVDGTKVGIIPHGESVYAASAKPSGKGQRLKMYFNFDWPKAPPRRQ